MSCLFLFFKLNLFYSVWLLRKWCKIEAKMGIFSMFLVAIEIYFSLLLCLGSLKMKEKEKILLFFFLLKSVEFVLILKEHIQRVKWNSGQYHALALSSRKKTWDIKTTKEEKKIKNLTQQEYHKRLVVNEERCCILKNSSKVSLGC